MRIYIFKSETRKRIARRLSGGGLFIGSPRNAPVWSEAPTRDATGILVWNQL
jgi:hypothetical protein